MFARAVAYTMWEVGKSIPATLAHLTLVATVVVIVVKFSVPIGVVITIVVVVVAVAVVYVCSIDGY